MKYLKILSLLLYFSLIFIFFSYTSLAYASLNAEDNPEENVITASDAGGGDLSGSEMIKIILIASAIIIGLFLFLILILRLTALIH